MPSFNVKITGSAGLKRVMDNLSGSMSQKTAKAINRVTEDTRTRAVSNLQRGVKHGSGELASSIKSEVKTVNGEIVGRVYSNKDTAIYREFGTGKNGANSQKDLPPDAPAPHYTMRPWFIPVEKVDVDLSAVYGMRKIKIKGKEFYMTNGQPARPFLYPAFKDATQDVASIVKEELKW